MSKPVPAHRRSFDTEAGQWQTIRIPFSDFCPVFRAKTQKDGPRLDPSSIASIQLMLSKFEYDGELNPSFQSGPFELPIADMRTYMPEPVAPKFVYVGSAGVTRPNRPGIDVEKEPPAVKLNDTLGGILTYKLKGEDVIRESGVPFCIVRPCALTEEPQGQLAVAASAVRGCFSCRRKTLAQRFRWQLLCCDVRHTFNFTRCCVLPLQAMGGTAAAGC